VGALCSWYHSSSTNIQCFSHAPETNPGYVSLKDSYICTLYLGCFGGIKSTDVKKTEFGALPYHLNLHTAREFLVTKIAYDFVCQTLSVLQQSTKAVIIKGATTETTTSKAKSDVVWVSCNGYRLFNRNKQQINNGKELTDMHINGAQALLKVQYPEMGPRCTSSLNIPYRNQQMLFRLYMFSPNTGQLQYIN